MAYVTKLNDEATPPQSVVLMLLAFVALSAALILISPGSLGDDGRILAGAAARLINGETAGRQALVGSIWRGALPLLMTVPAVAVSGKGFLFFATALSGAAGVGILLCVLWRELRRVCIARNAVFVTMGLLAAPLLLRMVISGGGRGWAVACATYAAVHTAQWVQTGQLRFLVRMGFASALLLLCGLDLAPWLIVPVVVLLLAPLCRRRLWRRWGVLVTLGALPALYAFGVWVLMNRLVMADAGFFLESLPGLWRNRVFSMAPISATDQLLAGLLCVGMLAGVLTLQPRLIVLGVMGEAAIFLAWVYGGSGLEWMVASPQLLAMVLLAIQLGWLSAHVESRYRLLSLAIALIPLGVSLTSFGSAAASAPLTSAIAKEEPIPDKVAAHVRTQTEHARVFVTGYDGLALLADSDDELFVPTLDLHLKTLRLDYWGQDLFLLVKRPEGRAWMDSIHWREPEIFRLGTQRAVYEKDWAEWRLFKVVTAPSKRVLFPDERSSVQ